MSIAASGWPAVAVARRFEAVVLSLALAVTATDVVGVSFDAEGDLWTSGFSGPSFGGSKIVSWAVYSLKGALT